MVLRWDELRKTISRRNIDFRSTPGVDGHLLAVVLELTAPPPPALADQIVHAGHQAANTPIEGVIGPRLASVSGQRITLILDPVSSHAIRLDTLLGALGYRGDRIGSPLAASVTITVLGLLEQIHNAPGLDGEPRVHGELHKGAVLLAPGGSVALLGPGLSPINAVLLPPMSREVDRFRILSPEAARGEPLDRRADVYSTGVLYYELVSGRPYLDHLTAALVCQRAIEGREPDLPAQLRKKRPGLYDVLARALAADRDKRFSTAAEFADAIYDELDATGISLGAAQHLSELIQDAVPSEVGRGPMALLSAEHEPEAFESVLATSDLTSSKPTAPARPLGAAPLPKFGDWGAVLDHEVTGINKVPEIAAAAAREFKIPEPEIVPPTSKGPTSKSGLPLPGAPSTPSAPAPSLLGADSPFASLEVPESGPTEKAAPAGAPPVVIIEDSSPLLKWGLIAAGVVTAVAIAIGAATSSDSAENDIDPIAQSPDAGVIVAVERDAGTVTPKPVTPPPPPPAVKNVGYLSVMSSPSGATVELDGGYVGLTPLVLRHDFEPRMYRIRVLAEGHVPWEREVRPDGEKKSISVVATLAPN